MRWQQWHTWQAGQLVLVGWQVLQLAVACNSCSAAAEAGASKATVGGVWSQWPCSSSGAAWGCCRGFTG